MKISFKLPVIILEITLIPLMILVFIAYSNAKEELTSQIVNKLEAVAETKKLQLINRNKQNLERLAYLASEQSLIEEMNTYRTNSDQNSQEKLQNVLPDMKKLTDDFEAVSVANMQGLVIASTNPIILGKSYAAEEFFQKGKEANETTFFAKDEDGHIVLYLAGPLLFDKAPIGVLVVKSNGLNITSVVSDYTGLGETGETLLVTKDANGDTLFLTPVRFDPNAALARIISKDKVNIPSTHAANGEEKIMLEAVDYNNDPVIAVTRYIPEAQWGIVAKVSRKEAYGPIEKLGNLLIVMGILSAVIIVCLSFSVSKSLTDPIVRLAKFADEISHRNFDTTTTTTGINSRDEIGILARSFNTMSMKLKEYYRELEAKVTEKTEQLSTKVSELEDAKKGILNIMEDLEASRHDLKKFQLAVANASDHIIITDREGTAIYANNAVEKITGFSKNEIIGKKAGSKELWGGLMDKEFYEKLWKTVKIDKKSFSGEIKNKRKNGQEYFAFLTISPILNEKGDIEFFVGIERDITAEKDREKEYVKDRAILQTLGEGLVVTDVNGKIEMVNQAFEKLTGWKQSEVLGKDMLEVLPKIDEYGNPVPRQDRSLYKILSSQTTVSQTSTLVHTHCYILKDGSKLPIMGIVTSIIYNNKLIGAVQVFHDISKEKDIDKMKDEFVSIASHELRTPLTAIDGLVSMILDGEYGSINDELKQPLEDISSSSERLIRLVNDLLSLSRIQAGRLKYTLTEFELLIVVKEVIDSLQSISINKDIELKICSEEKITVQGDSDKVKQVLNNLIGNSLKFTDSGSITVCLKMNKDLAEISIEDTGIGIPKEDQSKLFAKFQQLETEQGRPPGTGLGLHIAREIARKMGGDVWLEKSDFGKGSTFVFSLPIRDTELAKKTRMKIALEARAYPDQKSN